MKSGVYTARRVCKNGGVRPEYLGPGYRFHRLLDQLEIAMDGHPSASSVWLDLGCHNGAFLDLLKARYGLRGHGVDQWDPSLKENHDRWTYSRMDLDRGFDLGRRFDFISALELIEHVIDTDRFLADCARHLNPSGFLLLSTPNINSLRNRITGLWGVYPTGLEFRNEIHHVRLYNLPCLRGHLEQHGFRVLGMSAVNFLPMKWMGSAAGRWLSERWADQLPQLCGDVIVIAQKIDNAK